MEVKGRSDELRRQYNAMVQYMDNEIGKFVNALKSRGMWDNTLLVFVSDNGGPTYMSGGASNAPLRGGKLSDWEGGKGVLYTQKWLLENVIKVPNRDRIRV